MKQTGAADIEALSEAWKRAVERVRKAIQARSGLSGGLGRRDRRMKMSTRARQKEGSQTHWSSEINTAMPRGERNRERLSGETLITWNGEKNRCSEKGQPRAMPLPPVVKVSRIP